MNGFVIQYGLSVDNIPYGIDIIITAVRHRHSFNQVPTASHSRTVANPQPWHDCECKASGKGKDETSLKRLAQHEIKLK